MSKRKKKNNKLCQCGKLAYLKTTYMDHTNEPVVILQCSDCFDKLYAKNKDRVKDNVIFDVKIFKNVEK